MKWFKSKEEKQLDEIIQRLEMNMSNNYKDNAQANLKELTEAITSFHEKGGMKEAALARYDALLAEYQTKMKGYTHKDQKPYWH